MKEVYSSKAQFSLMAQCTGKFVLTSFVITRRKMNVKRRPTLIMHSKPHLRVKPLAVTYNCFIKSIFYGLTSVFAIDNRRKSFKSRAEGVKNSIFKKKTMLCYDKCNCLVEAWSFMLSTSTRCKNWRNKHL